MLYYLEEREQVLKELGSNENGLSEKEAKERLNQNGKNALEAPKGKSLIRRFLEQMKDPMIIILIVAAAVSGVLAVVENESFADAIIIIVVVIVNAVLGVYQENKAEKAIEALQKMAAATSKVLRDGKVQTIHSEDLVVGDVILLEAGDAVPADARILESASLKVEESALTGESVPVSKFIDIIRLKEGESEAPTHQSSALEAPIHRGSAAESVSHPENASSYVGLGDRKNMLYMGSTVVYGRGTVVVTATGMNTEMGKIAGALAESGDEQTPLQIKLNQLSKVLTWLVLGICIVVFAVQLLRAGSLSVDLVLDSFMVAVSLAVAAIPEGLAAVVTVVLSIGVTNMSKRDAIIRRLTAVETLGCAQVICSDKTGTLTQNKMTVVDMYSDDHILLATGMALCSDAELDMDGNITGEPTENALVAWAKEMKLPKYELKQKYIRCSEAPFDSERKMMSTVHKGPDGIVQFTKGAVDMVIGRCTHHLKDGQPVPMTEREREKILAENKNMADRALRVLACAKRTWSEMPADCDPETLEQQLVFVGLCGMIDPVRPEVKAAIEECRQAGIRPIMITGDHIDTATAIARELKILPADPTCETGEDGKNREGREDGGKPAEFYAITGQQLAAMDDATFEKEFQSISVYARVQPEQKTRIVNAWRKAGYVTAMTGDGVNDAPSIKAADIGVGMGITGTDVTKNVADMILADDNFATIVGAVEEGRRIYDNIRKAIQFLLGSNLSEVLSIFLATLMGFTILKPVHLLWINLVTDCFPALALGTEKAESDIMKRKPRNGEEGIFAEGLGVDVLYQGAVVTALTLASYFIGHFLESGTWAITDSADGTTMAFLTMSMAEIFHSLNMRSRRQSIFRLGSQNKMLLIAAVASLAATTLVCEVPVLAAAFDFASVEPGEYLIAILLGVMVIPIVEVVKMVQRRMECRKV